MPTRMPKKVPKDEYEEDFESEEDVETLIAKPMSKNKSGSKRQSRKSTRRPGSPSTRHRAHSAPGHKPARDLWINAVKNRNTSKLVNGRPPESPRRKTPVEYWVDTLRKSRSGISTESTGMNTFSGLKKTDNKNMPYLSTSAYLRQVAGTERTKRDYDPSVRSAPGTPAYKSSEEYYDEIIQLKKQVVALNHEVSTVRAKLRRTEEDNIKKGKDIEQLLDPSKSEELRRTLGDRKPDSAAVIHSLKQKILKLETQLKDKEASYSKLQSDLKTTKMDEMKTQLDVLYQEVVRLHNSKGTGLEKVSSKPSKESNVKMKALNETILRLNDTNQRLMTDNKTLKEDLQKALDDAAPAKTDRIREYEDMNKRELLTTLYGMKKRLDRAERSADLADGDTISQYSLDSYRGGRPASGKIVLEGTPEERLTQLDHRETELLEEIQRLKATIKRLRDDRAANRNKEGRGLTQRSPRPDSALSSSRGRRPGSTPRDKLPTPRDRVTTPRNRLTGPREPSPVPRSSRQGSIAESSRSSRGREREEMERKVNHFREDHAAKSIQREWRAHRYRQQEDEATESIQAAMRGHRLRKRQMERLREYDDGSSTLTDDSYDDAVNTIQSSLKGHMARKERLRTTRYESTEDEDDSISRRQRGSRPMSAKSSASSSRHNAYGGGRGSIFSRKSPTYEDDDEDDDDIVLG